MSARVLRAGTFIWATRPGCCTHGSNADSQRCRPAREPGSRSAGTAALLASPFSIAECPDVKLVEVDDPNAVGAQDSCNLGTMLGGVMYRLRENR